MLDGPGRAAEDLPRLRCRLAGAGPLQHLLLAPRQERRQLRRRLAAAGQVDRPLVDVDRRQVRDELDAAAVLDDPVAGEAEAGAAAAVLHRHRVAGDDAIADRLPQEATLRPIRRLHLLVAAPFKGHQAALGAMDDRIEQVIALLHIPLGPAVRVSLDHQRRQLGRVRIPDIGIVRQLDHLGDLGQGLLHACHVVNRAKACA